MQVVTDAGMNPHSAVRVLIKAGDVRRRRRILARPPKIPGVMPLGPPEETILNWQQLDVQPNLPTQALPEQQTRRRRSYNRRSEIPMPADDTQRSINDLSDDFVKEFRRFWSAILGRDVGDDDRASFQWKSQLRSPRNPSPTQKMAAHWRSTGKILAENAAKCRKSPLHPPLVDIWKLMDQHDGRFQEICKSDSDYLTKCKNEHTEWGTEMRLVASKMAISGRSDPTQLARMSAQALKRANKHEAAFRNETKQMVRDKLNTGASWTSNGTKLPGTNAFRMLKGPAGWAKPSVADSGYNSIAPRDEELESDEHDLLHNWDETPHQQHEALLSDQGDIECTADAWAALWEEHATPFLPPHGPIPSALPLLTG